MKNVAFIVSYLGDNPPKLSDVEKAVVDLDNNGIIQVEETNPIYELCDYCKGTGNEGTMNYIDCENCGGSGWIKK
jgi:hypothetical protein